MPLRLNSLTTVAFLTCLALLTSLAMLGCNRAAEPSAEDDPTKVAAESGETEQGAAEAAPVKARSHEYYPTVVLKTSRGDVTLKLDAKRAPRTVNNFLHYVESGHYNQTIFHQVEADYVVLGGSYAADLTEKDVRYPIPNEADNGRKNVRGTIAMARRPDEIDSATCQFFINLSDNPNLDHAGDSPEAFGFCVFGEVIGGMDVLDEISQLDVQKTEQFEKLPLETVLLETARRIK